MSTPQLKGLLHLADSGVTQAVTLTWDPAAGVLHLSGEGIERDVSAKSLSVSTGGWQGTAVHLIWKMHDRDWAITLTDRDTIQALAGLFSVALARQLDSAILDGIKATRRGRMTLAVLALLALVPPLSLLTLWLLRGPIVDAVVRRLPATTDHRLGELAFAELSRSQRVVAQGPAVDAVRTVGARLAAGAASRGTFRFELVVSPTANAYAAPNGLVVVHTGLVRAVASPEELAGVLAHEMTHVAERHTLRQLVVHGGLLMAVRLLVGSREGAADVLSGTVLDLTALRFSREQELAADRGALDFLARAHLSGSGLVSFFDRLARQGETLPPLLSSHPEPAARSAALLGEMARRGPHTVDPIAMDWAAVQSDAARREGGSPAARPASTP